jgi:ubiquitin-protein ligase
MSFNAKQIKKWEKTMEKKFQVEQKNSEFKIVKVDKNSLNKYYILLQPTGGHYKGHIYILEMITKQGKDILYPHTPPLIKFLNKIWHPNISVNGAICLDIIKGGKAWSPANSIGAVVSSILLLMDNPENSDAFNGQAATSYRVCEKQYNNIPKHILEDSIKRQEMYDLCYKSYDEKTKNFAGKNIEVYLTYFTLDDDESDKDIDKLQNKLCLTNVFETKN